MTPEGRVKAKIKKRLDAIAADGSLYYFVKEAKAIRGIPDIVGCWNGVFFALEVKKSMSECRKTTGRIVLQKYTMQRIQHSQGFARLICPENFDEVMTELQRRCCRQS